MGIIRGLILPVAILALGMLVFFALAASKAPPQRADIQDTATLVEVAVASGSPEGGFGIQVNGTVLPRRVIRMAAEIEGRIVEKSDRCEPGFAVRAGEVLLKIDSRELELQKLSIEADLAQVQADLSQLEVEVGNNRSLIGLVDRELDLQQRERQRVAVLAQRNSSSPAELEQADRQVLTAQRTLQNLQNEQNTFAARRDKLEAQRASVQARLDQVLYDLERTVIRAPVEGVVAESSVELNGYVRPGDALVLVEDTASLEVRCNLQMEDLYWLAKSTPVSGSPGEWTASEMPYRIPEAPATIRYRLAGETATWQGTLYRYEGGGIDQRTRTVPCRISIPRSETERDLGALSLRRGMFVEVALRAGDPRVPLLTIPREALRPNGEVWVVRDDMLRIVPIEVVRMLEDQIVIRAGQDGETGVWPGDRLVVSPLPSPVDGMAVVIDTRPNLNAAAAGIHAGLATVPLPEVDAQ